MKKIEFTKLLAVRVEVNGPSVDTHAAAALVDIARENKLRIIDAVLHIESTLSAIIANHFFSNAPEKRTSFESLVLRSDWCSFAAKRRLVKQIVKETKVLDGMVGIEMEELDVMIGKAMKYRNAFTHGHFESDGNHVWLNYYEGGPKHEKLTDEYLDEMKKPIALAIAQTYQLAALTGAVTARKSGESLPSPEKNM